VDVRDRRRRGLEAGDAVEAAPVRVEQHRAVGHHARLERELMPARQRRAVGEPRRGDRERVQQGEVGQAPDLHHVGPAVLHHRRAGGQQPVDVVARREGVDAHGRAQPGHRGTRRPEDAPPAVHLGHAAVAARPQRVAGRGARALAAQEPDEHVAVRQPQEVVRVAVRRHRRERAHEARPRRRVGVEQEDLLVVMPVGEEETAGPRELVLGVVRHRAPPPTGSVATTCPYVGLAGRTSTTARKSGSFSSLSPAQT
jgi:hypothetical protein